MSSTHKLKCPDCHHAIRVRNSVGLHSLLRAAYLQCTNLSCGATFRGQFEITHRMSPSSAPNPEIELPTADSQMRREAIAREHEKQIDIDDILMASATQ